MSKHQETYAYLFVCRENTQQEMFRKCIFAGSQCLYEKRAGDIRPGMRILVYNLTTKVVRGPYTALTDATNIDPRAWGGKFPCQVRFEGGSDVVSAVVPLDRRRGMNSGYLNQSRYDRIIEMMLGVLVEDAPNCVLLATSSFLSGSSQDKKAQMNKLLMAVVKNIMDKGKHAMDIITEDNRVLKRKIEELTAASQAPFKLPYYWDGDHASSNRPLLRDAYLPEGHNQHLAENMLNDCINPKCNENMRNGDPLRSICAQHLNYDRGLQMTCPFRIIKMERLENSEAFQRFQMHEAIVTRAMEKLPQRELDQVMSQRQSSSSGWLQKLEMKNDLKQMANTRYLLHGTKQEHLSDIIKKGLRAGFARDTSACIYGKGIYFADTSCKANQYTDNNNTSEKLILICRVVLGRSKLLPGCDREMRNAPEGYHSCHVNELTLNNANIPQVHNEYIVYNDIECYPEFLLRCKIDWHDP